jgi:two-component system sensor histidine kinase DesK
MATGDDVNPDPMIPSLTAEIAGIAARNGNGNGQGADTDSGADDDQMMFAEIPWAGARGWVRLVFPCVFLVYLLQTVGGVDHYSSGTAAVAGYLIVAAFAVVYVLGLLAAWESSSRRVAVAIGVMVVLYMVEVPLAHQDAFPMITYVVVLLIAEFGSRSIPLIVVLGVGATFVPALVPSWNAGVNVDAAVTIAVVSVAMFGFFAVLQMNRALSAARAEVARLAAENERNRIARDLHDLLGHSLTTITVKAGLANRLLATDVPRAAIEMSEVEELSRHSLAEVRAAVGNYRDVSLAGELATGRELMRAAGITMQHSPVDNVADAHRQLFGWVVREGLTNVVRHARANHCVINLGPNWIEIVDDGHAAGLLPQGDEDCGRGLDGLRERVEAGGGVMIAGPVAPSGWRLRVEVPTVVATSAAAAPAIGP